MCAVVFSVDSAICGDAVNTSGELSVCVRYDENLSKDIRARYSDWLDLAIETNRKENPMTDEEIVKKLTETEARSKSNTHRLDKIEESNGELTKTMNRMATAVEVLATEQRHSAEAQKTATEKIDKIDEKVSNIELAPAHSAKKIKEEIVKAIVTALIGAVIGALLCLILK